MLGVGLVLDFGCRQFYELVNQWKPVWTALSPIPITQRGNPTLQHGDVIYGPWPIRQMANKNSQVYNIQTRQPIPSLSLKDSQNDLLTHSPTHPPTNPPTTISTIYTSYVPHPNPQEQQPLQEILQKMDRRTRRRARRALNAEKRHHRSRD